MRSIFRKPKNVAEQNRTKGVSPTAVFEARTALKGGERIHFVMCWLRLHLFFLYFCFSSSFANLWWLYPLFIIFLKSLKSESTGIAGELRNSFTFSCTAFYAHIFKGKIIKIIFYIVSQCTYIADKSYFCITYFIYSTF